MINNTVTLTDARSYSIVDDAHEDSTYFLLRSEYDAAIDYRDKGVKTRGGARALTMSELREWDNAGRPDPNSLERRQWRHWAVQTGNTDEKNVPTVSFEEWDNEGRPVHPDFIDAVKYVARVILGTDDEPVEVNLTREDMGTVTEEKGRYTLQAFQAAITEIDPDYSELPVVAVIRPDGKYYPNGKGGLTKTAGNLEVREANRRAEAARREAEKAAKKLAARDKLLASLAAKAGMDPEEVALMLAD